MIVGGEAGRGDRHKTLGLTPTPLSPPPLRFSVEIIANSSGMQDTCHTRGFETLRHFW